MTSGGTPADWKDVPAVKATPVVKGPPPPIKGDVNLVTIHCPHRGWADQLGVFAVHRLQLHVGLKVVAAWGWRFLEDKDVQEHMKYRDSGCAHRGDSDDEDRQQCMKQSHRPCLQ